MIQFYEDKKNKWRWRIIADNGRIIGSSSQGFANKQLAEGNLRLVYEELFDNRFSLGFNEQR